MGVMLGKDRDIFGRQRIATVLFTVGGQIF